MYHMEILGMSIRLIDWYAMGWGQNLAGEGHGERIRVDQVVLNLISWRLLVLYVYVVLGGA